MIGFFGCSGRRYGHILQHNKQHIRAEERNLTMKTNLAEFAQNEDLDTSQNDRKTEQPGDMETTPNTLEAPFTVQKKINVW